MLMGWDYFWAKVFHRFEPVLKVKGIRRNSSDSESGDTRSNDHISIPVPEPLPEDEEDVNGKIVLITGGNGGLGQATAIQLVLRGAIVIIACRDQVKGLEAVKEILKYAASGAQVHLMHLDLSHLANIREFATEFCKRFPHINILINNAGVMDGNQGVLKRTKDGFESNMGINHLGHFLLTLLLLDHVKKGAPSRIICISSTLHKLAQLNVEDLLMEDSNRNLGFLNLIAYNNSKLANIYFVKQLSKRLNEEYGSSTSPGVRVFSLCPGLVRTELFRNDVGCRRRCNSFIMFFAGLNVNQGCETILYCSLSKKCLKDPCGQLYRFRRPWKSAFKKIDKNDDIAERLWQVSEELVQYKSPILTPVHAKVNLYVKKDKKKAAVALALDYNSAVVEICNAERDTEDDGGKLLSTIKDLNEVIDNVNLSPSLDNANVNTNESTNADSTSPVQLQIDPSLVNSLNGNESDELSSFGITRL